MPVSRIPPRARRTAWVCLVAVLAAIYGIAWFAPATGLAYYEGEALVAARTGAFAGITSPPLFPAVLGLFALVSQQAQWLKFLPLLCTLLWLATTKRLLTKMGASPECAWMLVAMTAASPTVLYLSTGLFAEPLFALLVTASLLALLEERPLIAGLCAGLATVTLIKGAPLILAGVIVLTGNRRLRSAAWFTAGAMAFASPWLGWRLAHGAAAGSGSLPPLALSDWAVVLGRNAVLLAASPFTLLTGYPSPYPGLLTAVALLIVLIRRRQLVPDLFIGLYCVVLLCRTLPPLHAFAPVLPLFLWMLWRVAQSGRFATITKAVAVLMIAPALWFGSQRVLPALSLGAVASETAPPDNWHEMETLFAFIRANTPPDAVLLADLDPLFYLNTGRRTVRGSAPPDRMRASILRDHVSYVALTPDRDLPESASFHKAVGALERGGVLEPVSVPGVSGEYRLLRVH